jgi:hypothetical protein
VDDANPQALGLHDAALGQACSQLGRIHVPVHGLDGREQRKLVEHRRGGEVACVHDDGGLPEDLHAGVWKPPPTPGQMRVADDRDQERPSTKRPSR